MLMTKKKCAIIIYLTESFEKLKSRARNIFLLRLLLDELIKKIAPSLAV